jgi:uncharacterized RDD family membrane protein YckC
MQDKGIPEYVCYARVGVRVKAFLIDYFVVLGALLIAALVGANVHGTGAFAFCLWLAFLLLYDPLMVWRTSGTVGHHLQNLRVVSDKTGANPTLPAALLRNLTKTLFGSLSFLAMTFSRRKKTFHDWVAGTTVQIRDQRLARLRDYERVAPARVGA